MNILNKIVQHKRTEIAEEKINRPEEQLSASVHMNRQPLSMSTYLTRADKSGIIAEFKRRSPSLPSINLSADVAMVTTGYTAAGASALSVLTDEYFFGGSTADLSAARAANDIPILRKDFIIDPYQILAARSMGADAILLIAEILSADEVRELSIYAGSLGLEVLMELHSEDQLEKYHSSVHMIGVNNRDLSTFNTSIDFSKQLVAKLPAGAVKVSESGISSPETIRALKEIGYQGFLIGERFMKSTDPGSACATFINAIPS